LNDAFNKINKGADLKSANKVLKKFLSDCGTGVSKVSNLKTWVELISVTGIMHGSTLSFTRLLMTQPIVNHLTTADTYGKIEMSTVVTAGATITGVDTERYVFSDKLVGKGINPLILSIATKYAGKTTELKVDYWKRVSNNQDFAETRWIICDFCMDGIDGKQLTIATYV